MKRIGIFGGTFDPPHRGHIAIAEQAIQQLGLNRVYFVPAYIPPHKLQYASTTARHRLHMMKLAIRGNKYFKVSTIELKRGGISYTVDTVKAFKLRFPKDDLILIIGADNLTQFHAWKSPKTILKLASLAVYRRKGFNKILIKSSIDYSLLKGGTLNVSSTEIRNTIKKGVPLQGLVPHSIIRYIHRHSLYSILTHDSPKRPLHEIHRIR
jgi:nicotinate-nucleotide adenylyltransferase